MLRLWAYTRFVLFNGLQQVGRDKAMLVGAAALSLLLTVAAAWGLRSLPAMALAHLLAALWLAWTAHRAEAGLMQQLSPSVAAPAAAAEMRGLFALNAAGFVNLGTCVPLATLWLPADQGVAFGFWFRAAAVASVLAGFHAQIRFPQWARSGVDLGAMRGELLRAQWLLLLFAAGIWATQRLCVVIAPTSSIAAVSALTMLALCACAALTAASQLLGAALMARGQLGFIRPAVLLALAAPLLAGLGVALLAPQALIAGYLVSALGLRVMLGRRMAELPSHVP